ncbi:MAG: nucleotidyltransferase [Verrucomicrobia bacterium]|nr:nucleotidyltransferase [Verrucomicrobiota bacterium]
MGDVLHEDFLDFIKTLNANSVEYMVVGGYAVIFHGYPRTTGDLDVWVKKTDENYDRLVDALSDFQMPVFDMTRENFLNNPHLDVYAFGRSPVSIEILNTVKGLEFEKAYANAVSIEIDGTPVRFLSRSDLLTAKRAVNRPRDINDIDNLLGE